MKNKNKFDSKKSIVWGIIFNITVSMAALYYVIALCLMNPDEFAIYIEHYITTGTGASRRSGTIVDMFYSGLGRLGVISFFILCNFILWYVTFKSLSKLRRYLHKERLFKMGLVSNMDDDDKPLGIVKRVKQLFKKSKGSPVFKYTRKDLRKMKKELEDMENKSKR